MEVDSELRREREYTARVQQLLLAAVARSKGNADFQIETVRMMLSDAWEELRMRPTALSQQDIDQLNAEIDRFFVRRSFSEGRAEQYERMLMNPYFARVDFLEDGEEGKREKIVIGLYSLRDGTGDLVVHDWRAPVCSLYYDAMPGPAGYDSPSGRIDGRLLLKRQYSMEQGKLKYYVDTEYSIDDGMLLDILSGATSAHMRQIVATIQTEQNAAIRYERTRVLTVLGGAGSGKTSVAMHRAAYLMYRHRDTLDASKIAVMSPSGAFVEYISNVLPDLGEENAKTLTMWDLARKIIGRVPERPLEQYEALLAPDARLRLESVKWKASDAYLSMLTHYCERFTARGPHFESIMLGKQVLATRDELERLYRFEYKHLNPAQRLTRMRATLDKRLEDWEKSLYMQYEDQLMKAYRGKDLDFATHMAVAQRLHPLRGQLKRTLAVDPCALYAGALRYAPDELHDAARANAEAKVIWWEDAPGIALLMVKLGFVKPDDELKHLLVDEAQDYTGASFALMHAYYAKARVTLLGDPNQRTLPGLPACRPKMWGALMGQEDAPVVTLTRGYRSTVEITDFCNALLPDGEKPSAFGRNGETPLTVDFSPEALLACIGEWRGAGHSRIAVVTRSQREAEALSTIIKGANLLTGDEDELEGKGVDIACVQLIKGLEYDAVAVVWPKLEWGEDERRRLYTACSRALHALKLFQREVSV